MVEHFLDYALGPYGRMLGDFYFENQVLLNSLVVGVALYKLFSKQKKKSAQPDHPAESNSNGVV
ncbi:hypothetical protein ACFQ49_04885 [Kroppenstedtia eburnea]|uniref:hypothetical protein n=1 Tax=Kroppenstedtia eburnea TaxID=714067 RepID=UPI0036427566